jgi:hypothetical protein
LAEDNTGETNGIADMLSELRSEDLSPYLNKTFRILRESSEPLEVELADISELGSGEDCENPGKRRPFSVIFRAPEGTLLPQRIYSVEHDTMGPLEIFLVPVGSDKKGTRYEAIFA